jgi:hypothetical protein
VLTARLLVAVALAVTGAVHLDLASSYDGLGDTVTVGALFRAQGAVALLVAGWLVVRRRDRLPLLAALLVGAASTAAVVLSVYVRVPALGPLPELYEPVWYAEKNASALASALAALGAAALLGRSRSGQVP